MRAMILAAGLGKRLRPLTNTIPKPMLEVRGQPLIVYHIRRLQSAGISELVINLHHLGDQIRGFLGNGKDYGVSIEYTDEPVILETGGGINHALPLLGSDPFLVVSADLWTDYPFAQLVNFPLKTMAHLILTPNPPFHPHGDFHLQNGLLSRHHEPRYNFGGISILTPELFSHCHEKVFPLNKVLFPQIDIGRVSGELFTGLWKNVGTAQDLAEVNGL